MVAILSPSKSLRNSFYYNENKVKHGVATLLHAENYPKDLDDLSENMRLGMLQKLASQNTNVAFNSMHITLNFDPSEHLSWDKMIEIARVYMDKIGFGNQPYLVYQHFDAGHPHLHLVTTTVEASGKPINLHHLGIRKSEPARKEIELGFGLVKAEDQKLQDYKLKPAYSAKVVYGRTDSRRAIQNVLAGVMDAYKYESLHELNAILGQYNVRADRGDESSRLYKNGGLQFRVLDDSGSPVGVPIKASLLYNRPTLKRLEKYFLTGAARKSQYKSHVKNIIDLALRKPGTDTLVKLIAALNSAGIHCVLRENKDGVIYGITYVDHNTKSVFNGSDLDKAYSIKGIIGRLEPGTQQKNQSTNIGNVATIPLSEKGKSTPPDDSQPNTPQQKTWESLLESLMQNEGTRDFIPFDLRGKKKKRKKRKSI
jgi:hypothetical protein